MLRQLLSIDIIWSVPEPGQRGGEIAIELGAYQFTRTPEGTFWGVYLDPRRGFVAFTTNSHDPKEAASEIFRQILQPASATRSMLPHGGAATLVVFDDANELVSHDVVKHCTVTAKPVGVARHRTEPHKN